VLEAMRAHHVPSIVFPSTSGVYGSLHRGVLDEATGPLLPNSLYAAGKLACEGLISAYCATFQLRARMFRLGNAVGGAMARGIVPDFIRKLREEPTTLRVLGDGGQRKSFVLVDDVIDGMIHIGCDDTSAEPGCDIYNLAAGGSADVAAVAEAVATAMGIPRPRLVTGGDSWRGDQPVVELRIAKAMATGWRPTYSPQEALRIAAERLLAELDEQLVTA
jgi:UDP-glucose 4-epimerase